MSSKQAGAVRWLVRLYGLALLLYPEGARREYAQEMQEVFSLKANDTARLGVFALVRFACREALDLPGAIVRTHLNEKRAKLKIAVDGPEAELPLNSWKIAAVFLPFLLAMLLSMANSINKTFFAVLSLTLLGLLIAVWIAGLVNTFPVWALPSLGMLFFIIYFYFLRFFAQTILYLFVMLPLFGGWPKDLFLGILTLLLIAFGTILTVTGALTGLLLLLPKFRSRVRKDWTLLSFFLYGLAILPMFMDDEFHHLGMYQFASLLILAAGACLYLVAPLRWQRILVLVIPVVLSQAIIILGLHQTYPLEAWITLSDPNQRIWEAVQPLADPLPILLLLPALIPFIPRRGKPGQAPSRDHTLPVENQ